MFSLSQNTNIPYTLQMIVNRKNVVSLVFCMALAYLVLNRTPASYEHVETDIQENEDYQDKHTAKEVSGYGYSSKKTGKTNKKDYLQKQNIRGGKSNGEKIRKSDSSLLGSLFFGSRKNKDIEEFKQEPTKYQKKLTAQDCESLFEKCVQEVFSKKTKVTQKEKEKEYCSKESVKCFKKVGKKTEQNNNSKEEDEKSSGNNE